MTGGTHAKPRVERQARHKRSKAGAEWIRSATVGLVAFVVIRTTLFQTFVVISESMERTLLVGDFLVVSKAAYGARVFGIAHRMPGYGEPEHGDIVVFRGPAEPIDIVKRLVGMPGDTLRMANAVLYRNGVEVREPFVNLTSSAKDLSDPRMLWQVRHTLGPSYGTVPTRDNWGPLVVPAQHYFMLGDNRNESLDSRFWGPVPEANIIGKVTLVYFSWSNQKWGKSLVRRVRWSRIGDRPD